MIRALLISIFFWPASLEDFEFCRFRVWDLHMEVRSAFKKLFFQASCASCHGFVGFGVGGCKVSAYSSPSGLGFEGRNLGFGV